jgi:hypothetical protein
MAHILRHRPANRTRRSKLAMRRLSLWVALHAQVCECCGLALWGRRYTNAALQQVCRDCFLCGLPACASSPSPDSAMASERIAKERKLPCISTVFTKSWDRPR